MKDAINADDIMYYEDLVVYCEYGFLIVEIGCYRQSLGYKWEINPDENQWEKLTNIINKIMK